MSTKHKEKNTSEKQNELRDILQNDKKIDGTIARLFKQARWSFFVGVINGMVWLVLTKLMKTSLDFSGLFKVMIVLFCISLGFLLIGMMLKIFKNYYKNSFDE